MITNTDILKFIIMKNLARIFFCTFSLALFFSCEPEEMPVDPQSEIVDDKFNEMGDTGDQKDEIDDDKDL